MPGYIFILLLLLALWLLLIRPAQRRQKQQQAVLSSIEVGDEIVTAGGLYGTVTALDDDEVHAEIAPGIEVRIARRAVAGVVSDKSEPAASAELEEPDEPEEFEPAEESEGRTKATLSD